MSVHMHADHISMFETAQVCGQPGGVTEERNVFLANVNSAVSVCLRLRVLNMNVNIALEPLVQVNFVAGRYGAF